MDAISHGQRLKVGDIITSNTDYSNLQDKFVEVIDKIKIFYSTLIRLNPNINFNNLKNNIEKLNVVLFLNGEIPDFMGAYDITSNEINLDVKYIDESIYHELFHLASSKRDGVAFSSGFLLDKGKECVYFGINEGYTDLLAERYYHEKVFYEIERDIAFLIEKIVMREKMEELYYCCDVSGLICELEKYCLYDDILSFLTKLDYISAHIGDEDEIVFDSCYDVGAFLIKAYYEKERILLEEEIISYSKFIYDVSSFVRYVEKYNILNNIEVSKIIYEIMSNNSKDKCMVISK